MTGRVGYLAFKAGGQAAVGSYTECANTRDVTISLENTAADASVRGPFKSYDLGQGDLTLSFQLYWANAAADCVAIRSAAVGKTIVAFQVLDAAAGKGFQGDFIITKFEKSEPLDDTQVIDVECKPAKTATPPSWIGET